MSAETVQDAVVNQLKGDSAVAAEFSTNISKGMGRNFDFIEASKGIRVYQMVENFSQTQLPNTLQTAVYPFLLIVLFYEPDEALGETRKTQYSTLVRKVAEKDPTFGGTCYDSVLGDTRFYFHPQIEGAYYMAIPLMVKRQEIVG